MKLTREQVVAHRVAVQGLHRDAATVGDLGVLDLGFQEAMGHSAAIIFAARLPDASVARDVSVGPDDDFALAWTFRGAPHVHRRSDLRTVRAALWPLSEADAMARLNETSVSIKTQGISALDQFGLAVKAMREVVTRPTAKGAVSTEVTARLPEAMRHPCRPCKTTHISDSAMRLAAPVAGLELEPGTSPPVLLRTKGARVRTSVDRAAVTKVASDYLTYLGPARDADVAGFLGARRADVAGVMPDGLVEVTVDGAKCVLPSSAVDAVDEAPDPAVVRLLGAYDPYLQARDRDLIVPDRAAHKALWPVLGRPGALFADGEIVGTWRTKRTAKRLTITVETFGRQPKSLWPRVDEEAERVAVVRGNDDVTVTRA